MWEIKKLIRRKLNRFGLYFYIIKDIIVADKIKPTNYYADNFYVRFIDDLSNEDDLVTNDITQINLTNNLENINYGYIVDVILNSHKFKSLDIITRYHIRKALKINYIKSSFNGLYDKLFNENKLNDFKHIIIDFKSNDAKYKSYCFILKLPITVTF